MMNPANLVSFEAQGKLRMFRRSLATHYAATEGFFRGTSNIVGDFVYKRGVGRRRVFDRINHSLLKYGSNLDRYQLKGREPHATWAILKPREAVTLTNDPRDKQPCICVNYLTLGALPAEDTAGVMEGLWSLEITDHALGRCFQSNPNADMRRIIFATHQAATHLPNDMVSRESFRLNAYPHTWIAEVRMGHDLDGSATIHLMLRTYLHFDELSARQESELVSPSDTLNTLLAPRPFRIMHDDGNSVRVAAATAWFESQRLVLQ